MGKSKKDKLPRGAGRLPEWWLEITPHETLFLEEDEAKRQADHEEAMKFAELAAREDLYQKYGGEGFPNWNPAADGPRTKQEEKEWAARGYSRNEKEEWVNEQGAPLEGRQFKGEMPPGYWPGQYSKGGGGGGGGGGSGASGDLNPTSQYERDKDKAWSQPSWMKVKLRSTGNQDTKAIVKGDGTRVTPGEKPETSGNNEEEIIEEIIADEDIIEVFEDDDGNEIVEAVVEENELTELQKILKRRQQASG